MFSPGRTGSASSEYRMALNNVAQANRWHVNYISSSRGPQHDTVWEVAVYVNNDRLGNGMGQSKFVAMEAAAHAALQALRGMGVALH
jgi:ribonuclease-3